MGHGIEVAFEIDGKPQWEHGEVVDFRPDEVRVKYYGDKTRHWHSRFRMDFYGQLAAPKPADRGATGLDRLATYHWRLLNNTA